MEASALEVLDVAIAAGGTSLTKNAIVGKRKGAGQTLAQLCESGFLRKDKTKYSVTPEGRAAWEQHAPLDRREQVEAQERHAREQLLAGFLGQVEKKGEKSLTKAELTKHASVLEEARNRQMVEPSGKKDAYRLLPAGREFLLTQLPLEQQVAQLRELHQQVQERWNAAQKGIQQDLDGFGGQGKEDLTVVTRELGAKVDRACEAYESTLGELQASTHLLRGAQRLKESILATSEAAVRQVEEGASRARSYKEKACEALAELRTTLGTTQQELGDRIDAMAQQFKAPTQESSTHSTGEEVQYSANELGREIVAFVHRWKEERDAGCPLNALYQHLQEQFPKLTTGIFHDMLRALDEREQVRLSGWGKTLPEIPEPELALFISSKVMYYAHPTRKD